jgi:uncharacterized protein DUF6379
MKNTFSERLLPADEVTIGKDRVGLGVRLPWYRSLPLSVVEIGELAIDGKIVPSERMKLTLDGKTYSLSDLPERTEHFWYVLDSARLDLDWALDPTRGHEVTLTMNLYPPYIPGLTWVTRGSLTIKPH